MTLLREFSEGHLAPEPVPVQQLVEKYLGLSLLIASPADLGLQDDVLGAIFFEDNEVFVNANLNEGRFNFTLAHEVGHHQLHRGVVDPLTFVGTILKKKEQPGVLCRARDRSRIEVQADIYASCLLMPKPLVSTAARDVAARHCIWHDGSQYIYSRGEEVAFLGDIARRFRVSREAMKYRLERLGLAALGLPHQSRLF